VFVVPVVLIGVLCDLCVMLVVDGGCVYVVFVFDGCACLVIVVFDVGVVWWSW